MISSFTCELRRRGKGDIPGLGKRGSRTRWLEESSIFHIRMLLSAGTLQRYSFTFSSLTPRAAQRRWHRQNQVAVLIHRLACSKYQLQCFPSCPPSGKDDIWEYPWLLCKALRAKQGMITSHNVQQWRCTEPSWPSSLPQTHVRSWSKPQFSCISLSLHGYDLLGSNFTSSFHFFSEIYPLSSVCLLGNLSFSGWLSNSEGKGADWTFL